MTNMTSPKSPLASPQLQEADFYENSRADFERTEDRLSQELREQTNMHLSEMFAHPEKEKFKMPERHD